MAVGVSFTCALEAGGAAWCWGNNAERSLGAGTSVVDASTPVRVVGGQQFSSLSVHGQSTVCGLTSSGSAYCWGPQVPDGSSLTRATPSAVAGAIAFRTMVDGGTSHNYSYGSGTYSNYCGLDLQKRIWCARQGDSSLGSYSWTMSDLSLESLVKPGGGYICGVDGSTHVICGANNLNGNRVTLPDQPSLTSSSSGQSYFYGVDAAGRILRWQPSAYWPSDGLPTLIIVP